VGRTRSEIGEPRKTPMEACIFPARYIGCKQRLRNAVNDHIGLEPDEPS
jgi:hypothetical protein